MLPRAHRMRRSADFTAAVRHGSRTGRPRLVVHLLAPTEGAEHRPSTAGFVVSKAVGGAVVRNRVKRRLRHLVAPRIAQLPPSSHLVVRALPASALASASELAQDLDAALARATARRPRHARTGAQP